MIVGALARVHVYIILSSAGESPLSSLQERLCSPGSTARRALFTKRPTSSSTAPPLPTGVTPSRTAGGSTTPPKSYIPIAPKPSQGGVTITPLKGNVLTKNMLTKELNQILKALSPQKESNLPSPQATKTVGDQSDATMSTPLVSRQDNTSITSSPSTPIRVPFVSITVMPSPSKTISIITPAELLSGTKVSPSTVTIGSLLSPGSLRRPDIPTSPPIPSATITPSPRHSQLYTPPQQGGTPRASATKPKRTGSLALFYRKMYQLSYIRIKDLCERLGMANDFVQK